jgi:hypothetical protein
VYAKKFAAENQYSKFVESGLPNLLARRTSSDIVITSLVGPHAKGPANAPMEVATDGTIVVRSTSDTFTPADN